MDNISADLEMCSHRRFLLVKSSVAVCSTIS